MTPGETPLVISCQGGSASAELAGRAAAALGDLGAAEPVMDADLIVRQASTGRGVVALDGCPSACSARLLEARGLSPTLALNVADLGAGLPTCDAAETAPARVQSLAVGIARRIHEQPTVRRRSRAPRPAPPESSSRAKQTHGVDDYLLAIDALGSTVVPCGALSAAAPTLAAHVSQLLGVSRPSAGEMLDRLEVAGLVERSAHKELTLTADGRLAADRAVRRHRLLERLATDYLGYPLAECYERARMLGRAFDEEAIERVCRALGEPERCPHGWPVDPCLARAESRELSTLATLAPGERATVARLVEQDAHALARLDELRLLPGAAVRREYEGTGAAVAVTIADGVRTLDAEMATRVLLRRER